MVHSQYSLQYPQHRLHPQYDLHFLQRKLQIFCKTGCIFFARKLACFAIELAGFLQAHNARIVNSFLTACGFLWTGCGPLWFTLAGQ
jgi:hypothetical protein